MGRFLSSWIDGLIVMVAPVLLVGAGLVSGEINRAIVIAAIVSIPVGAAVLALAGAGGVRLGKVLGHSSEVEDHQMLQLKILAPVLATVIVSLSVGISALLGNLVWGSLLGVAVATGAVISLVVAARDWR